MELDYEELELRILAYYGEDLERAKADTLKIMYGFELPTAEEESDDVANKAVL